MDKNKVLIWIIVVLVVVLGFFMVSKQKSTENTGYSVVYVATGEVYVGKLKTFPTLELRDAYVVQNTKDVNDPSKTSFQLQPIKETLWAPEYLKINKENVIFYGPILASSKIAQTLAQQAK